MFRDLGGDCLETLQNRGILRATIGFTEICGETNICLRLVKP